MKLTRAWIRSGAAGLSLLACVACPGSLDDPSRFFADAADQAGGEAGGTINEAGACPDVPTQVFVPTCTTMGCHSTADKIQGLDLQSSGVASRLVGMCAGGGGYLVDPNNPAQSVLYTKLGFTPPYGTRMPLGKTPLDTATLACVLAWISAQTGSVSTCVGDGGATDAGGN
jgi:hypothetical protein